MKKFTLYYILILVILPFYIDAQGWEKTYDNGHNERIYAADKTLDGGVIMAGLSRDTLTNIVYNHLIKTDADGILQWQFYDSINIGANIIYDVISTADNGYLLSSGYSSNTIQRGLVQKIHIDGSIIWENDLSTTNMTTATHITKTNDGGYIWIGDENYDLTGSNDIGILKVDASGMTVWEQSFTVQDPNIPFDPAFVKEAANGDIIVFSQSYSGIGGGGEYFSTKRLDANGNVIWEQEWNWLEGALRDVIELPSGELMITGYSYASGIPIEGILYKVSSDGNLLWSKNYTNLTGDSEIHTLARGIVATDDGGFVIFGSLYYDELFLLKVDENGTEEWVRSYYGKGLQNIAAEILKTNDGGFYLASSTEEIGERLIPYLIRTDSLGYSLTNELSGNVFNDVNDDCLLDNNETGLNQWLVQVTKDDFHYSTLTDSLGDYSINVDTGTYEIQVSVVSPYWALCQNNYTQTFATQFDTISQNIAAQAIVDCPLLDISIGTPFLRRCFDNTYYVQYCNYGTETAANAYVEVTLDSFMTYSGSDAILVANSGDQYTFDVGNVGIGECGDFRIDIILGDDQETCDSILLGATHCVMAHIFPDSICAPIGNWSGASVEVDAICEGDSIKFIITNVGNAPTQSDLQYLVIEDDVILYGGDYDLQPGEITEVVIATNGSTFRLEAEQEPNHPGMSMPSVTVEGCGDIVDNVFSWGFVNIFSSDDANPFIDIDCMQNTGAFDPNDKTGFPLGYGDENNIARGQDIEYMIRFQNTGTDTAFNIVIRDTLSQLLDLSSVRPGASSHSYEYSISGDGIIIFRFPDIMLVDSTANEPASHGFVKFKVAQTPNLSIGTEINNSAAIYFDFNAPIITNTTLHTISETLFEQYASSITIVDYTLAHVSIFPNPFSTSTTIAIDGVEINDGMFKLYDALGRLVRMEKMNQNSFTFHKNGLQSGIYFVNIEHDGILVSSGKLVVE